MPRKKLDPKERIVQVSVPIQQKLVDFVGREEAIEIMKNALLKASKRLRKQRDHERSII